jgi:outer membrane protein assembly factor BamB
LTVAGPVSMRLVCLNRRDGKQHYDVELFHYDVPEPLHKINSYASPTPVIEGDRIYCHFGTYGTACVDATSGKTLWTRRFEIDHMVGPGSSPILHGKLLILTCDGCDKQFIVAVDKQTGETVWKVDRPPIDTKVGDMRKSFCTPLIVKHGGREQMIVPGAQWFVSYNPQTGKELWRVNHGSGFSVVPRPVHANGIVYLCTGFAKANLWAVRIDGSGDVTETHVVWRNDRQIPLRPSPILLDGLLYVISDTGMATCFEAATGDTAWTKRIPGNYSASPLLAAGRIYFFGEDGKTTVIKPGRSFEQLAVNTLEEGCMASAAALEGALYVRTRGHLYRIESPKSATAMAQ